MIVLTCPRSIETVTPPFIANSKIATEITPITARVTPRMSISLRLSRSAATRMRTVAAR